MFIAGRHAGSAARSNWRKKKKDACRKNSSGTIPARKWTSRGRMVRAIIVGSVEAV